MSGKAHRGRKRDRLARQRAVDRQRMSRRLPPERVAEHAANVRAGITHSVTQTEEE